MLVLVLALICVPAFVAGLGVISPNWIIGSALVAYAKSIMAVAGERGVDDFRKLESKEFMEREKNIKLILLRHAVVIAIAYGVGYLLSFLISM